MICSRNKKISGAQPCGVLRNIYYLYRTLLSFENALKRIGKWLEISSAKDVLTSHHIQ